MKVDKMISVCIVELATIACNHLRSLNCQFALRGESVQSLQNHQTPNFKMIIIG